MDESEDLSSWLGKPPASLTSDIVMVVLDDVPQPGANLSNSNESEADSGSNNSEEEIAWGDAPAVTTTQPEDADEGERAQSDDDVIFVEPRTRHKTFSIDVPPLNEDETYEYLPGHFAVKRVLSEYKGERFLVKLGSGEADLVTADQLLKLRNGLSSLDDYRIRIMSRAKRHVRKPELLDMVNWSSLNVETTDESSEDELSGGLTSRRRKPASPGFAGQDSEAEAESSDADEAESESETSHPAGRRSSRQKEKKVRSYFKDEIANSDYSESRLRPRRLQTRSSRGRSLNRSIKRSSDADGRFEKPSKSTRKSERTRTLPHRSMRERQEDEISAQFEEDTGPKVVATKEVFPRLPENDLFRLRHRRECDTCKRKGDDPEKGPIVFCQGCTNSHHKTCLGNRGARDHLVTKIGEGHFVLQCRRCIGIANTKDRTAPHLGRCEVCKVAGPCSKPLKSRLTTKQEQLQREKNGGQDPITIVDANLITNPVNVLFRCCICQRGWHMQHMPARNPEETDEDDVAEQEIAQLRFDWYSHSWECKDCVENRNELDTLIAWRPIDLEAYIPGYTVEMMEESKKEYLVKWRAESYFRTTWMPGSWVWAVAAGSMKTAFNKRESNSLPKMTTKDAIPEDFFRIDIVFEVRYSSVFKNSTMEIDLARAKDVDTAYVKYKGLGYEDAIWEKPPNWKETERWNDFKIAYEESVMRRHTHIPSQSTLRRQLGVLREMDFGSQVAKMKQPSTLSGGEMMGYQLEGLNWLYYQWFINHNAILADEMGLGKTIQLIAFFATLVQDHKCWPFLVVVPNSTCPNWRREIRKWAPSLRVVTYYGSAVARKLAQDFELFHKNDGEKDKEKEKKKKTDSRKRPEVKDIQAHIVVASYESIVEEKTRKSLMGVPWQGLVVDEGQRLKNDENIVYDALSKIKFPFKVLLTGTPLQNNARELFNLLQFLDVKVNAVELEVKYATLTKENVPELHELIRPFFLRRTKVQVLTFLPPMAQIIIPVTMSTVQKKLYKSILAKNPQLMKSIFSREGPTATKDKANLNNILMQLRKTLCHPFVYNRQIEERTHEVAVSHRNLIEASAKLQLLQIMLPKLEERGHRVLIFSQFLDNLDVVEDFLDGLGLQHRRLDGTINSLEKQKRIDAFNAADSPYFAFLLSTRSGGVGINLATADTVIIMDPDFNPHQDIQALSRAHRIGQKSKVLVFQIMTRDSAEEKIMQIGKKKMALDHIMIQEMDREDDASLDLESILRHGAEALFSDDNTGDIVYDSASVDKLLDRSQIEDTSTGEDKSAESQFSFARIWANDKAALEEGLQDSGTSTPNPGIWDKILQERERAFAKQTAREKEAFGRGKRKRQTVDYQMQDAGEADFLSPPLKDGPKGGNLEASDTDFQAKAGDTEDESVAGERDDFDLSEEVGLARPSTQKMYQPTTKARPFKRVKVPTGQALLFNGDAPADYIPMGSLPPYPKCSACHESHPMGWCRLKIAGVEHCNLCGLPHVGYARACPHVDSEPQISMLLQVLKDSTETTELKDQASSYLRRIRGALMQRRNAQEKQAEKREARELREHATKMGLLAENGVTGNHLNAYGLAREDPRQNNMG